MYGLAELEKLKIWHHDLSDKNILLTRKGEVKIIDFGLSVDYSDKI